MPHHPGSRNRDRTSYPRVRLVHCTVIIVLILAIASCSSSTKGSGNATVQSYPAGAFSTIEIGDDLPVDLHVRADGEQSVEITIDDNLHDHLRVETVDGRLVVSSGNIAPSAGIRITVSGYVVTGLHATADAEVHATLPEAGAIYLQLDHSARATVDVATDTLTVVADHDGVLDVIGRATRADITADNDAVVRLDQATVAIATVDARNDAAIEVSASESITGSARSDAIVRTGGNATVQVETTDDAQIETRG